MVAAEAADSSDYVFEIRLVEVRRSQVFYHVIKDEQCKFLAFLFVAFEAARNDLVSQCLHKPRDALFMRLE